MTGTAAGQRLPAANGRVDIAHIKLQPVAAPTGALGGDQRRATAEKGVEYDVAAGRTIEDRVGNHCHRFDGRVQLQEIAVLAAAGKGVGPRIGPDVAAVAAKPAELNVIAMPAAAVFEDEHEFVLAAVERAHPAIGFGPDAEVQYPAIRV